MTLAQLRRHRGTVRRALAQHGIAEHELDDVEQDVFVVALRYSGQWARRGRLSTWLYAVARSRARMHRRSCARRARYEHQAAVQSSPPTPEQLVIALELARAVRALKPRYAATLEAVAEGATGEEIQALNGQRSVVSARRRIMLARVALEESIPC